MGSGTATHDGEGCLYQEMNADKILLQADPNQPGWQTAFYGDNYDRLLAVKNKYDPDHVLYAHTAVGSDSYWTDNEGRLCRG